MPDLLPISLCTFVKNEEKSLRDCFESVAPIISEFIVVDTGSSDNTVQVAKKLTSNVYSIGFSDFGSIRTITAHLANMPWVLMLDADERVDPADLDKFYDLINQPEGVTGDDMELDSDGNVVIDSWALPRKRWADKWMRRQVDTDSYPDWQVRLFRNHYNRPKIGFRRRIHETIYGCIKTGHAHAGPIIHHFQNVHKSVGDLVARKELYTSLYEMDIADGIEHNEPPVIDIDDV